MELLKFAKILVVSPGNPGGVSAVAALHRHDAETSLARPSAAVAVAKTMAQVLPFLTKVPARSHAGGVQQWSGTKM